MSAFRNACGWFPVDRPGGVAELIADPDERDYDFLSLRASTWPRKAPI